MTASRRIIPLLAFSLTIPGVLAAQVPGTRLRVIEDHRVLATGTLLRLSGDTLAYVEGRGPVTLILTPRQRVEMPIGAPRRQTLKGAGIGFVAGFATGAVLGAATYQACPQDSWFCIDFGRGGTAVLAGTMGGLVGAVIGAVAGASTTRPAWVPVGRSGLRPLVMQGRAGGVRLGASIDF